MTVVIPTYNRARQVARAIHSALSQTVADRCDVVVVDDGSTDETAAVLAGFGSQIHVVRQPNRGVSAARNAGIRAVPNELVAFLDSDDVWEPDKLQRQLEALRAFPQAVLVAGDVVERDGNGLARRRKRPAIPVNCAVDLAPELFEDNFLCTSAVMVRSSALAQTGLFRADLNCSEDYEMWLRLACRGPVVFLDHPLATYGLASPLNLTRDKIHLLRSQVRVRYLARQQLRLRPDCRPRWRAGLSRCLAFLRDHYYRAGRFDLAWRYGLCSLLHRPRARPAWEWARLVESLIRTAAGPPTIAACGAAARLSCLPTGSIGPCRPAVLDRS